MTKILNIRRINNSGVLSLGREWAGRIVEITSIDSNTWLIKRGEFVTSTEEYKIEKVRCLEEEKIIENPEM